MNNYEQQRRWSDHYIPFASGIIIDSLNLDPSVWYIKITTPIQDMQEAADLILTDGVEEFMIALRLRTASYMSQYPFDFTVRREYTAGYKTEYVKIMEGFAHMMFYGFCDGDKIVRWLFLSLDEFRNQHEYNKLTNEWEPCSNIVFERRNNSDGRNCFNGYDSNSFTSKEELIISHSIGYYADVIIKSIPGLKSGYYILKDKVDRLDN